MYIVGHVFLSKLLGQIDPEYSATSGTRALMLPDYADSHAFAYTHAWDLDAMDPESRLLKSHIAGDWWIHFSDDIENPARRKGWAYRRMGVIARSYDTFFREAHGLGLRDTPEPNDSRRGWAHSMLEYSVDTYLCMRGRADNGFEKLRSELGDLARHHDEVRRLFGEQQVDPWSRDTWSHAMEYSLRVWLSEEPEDLAIVGALGKFGFDYSPEAREFVRRYQRLVVESVGAEEYEDILRHMGQFVVDVDRNDKRPAIPGPPPKRAPLTSQAGALPKELMIKHATGLSA